ncbi:exocyst complex component 3 isoform X2 [Brachyhypopomus gauderio]|uniref:exocyst complex component 3 isoform X2 n=1 Tax=Brachyhypopomus gauderio TaxID=698409 RepID=UPI004041A4CC
MAKVFKTLKYKRKRKSGTTVDDNKTPLMSNMISPVDDIDGHPTVHMDMDPVLNAQILSRDEKSALSVLMDIHEGDIHFQEMEDAAEYKHKWLKRNGLTPRRPEDFSSYSQDWLIEYLNEMDVFAEKNRPTVPPEGDKGKYLNSTMRFMCSKVNTLSPVLQDSVRNYLIGWYNQHFFATLDLLMDKSSSMKEAFSLLNWVKETYFRQNLKGCHNIQDDVLRVSDPLLLTDWVEKSKQKILTLVQEDISAILQNILSEDQTVCDYRDEEAFIKLQLDVIQCLNATIQGTQAISHTLKKAIQRVCCDELHSFVERYVNAEKKRLKLQKPNETNSVLFVRTMYNCRLLRSYALTIVDVNNNTDSTTLQMLEKMTTHVLSSILQWLKASAEDHLKKYFKKADEHRWTLLNKIQNALAPLTEKEQGNEIKQSVTRAYLRCLMQRRYGELERRWGDVEKRVTQDAAQFHHTFNQLAGNANINLYSVQNGSDDEPKMFLVEVTEILRSSDLNALKLICSNLYKSFPTESEEYLSVLMNWKGRLSSRQIKEVLNVAVCQNGGRTRSYMPCWSCCGVCT